MKTTVARLYRFRATHSLPDFPEPWCFPHQHDYTVEVVAEGGTDTDELDFIWAENGFQDGLDLNETVDVTTVERIADVILTSHESLIAVTVWEDQARWGRAER